MPEWPRKWPPPEPSHGQLHRVGEESSTLSRLFIAPPQRFTDMIKLLLVLLLVVIAAHVITTHLRAGKRTQTSGNERVDRDKINRDKAIDVEYTEIVEENGPGRGP